MLLCGVQNLREITLFPMNQQAEDLLMGAPSPASPKQRAVMQEQLACVRFVVPWLDPDSGERTGLLQPHRLKSDVCSGGAGSALERRSGAVRDPYAPDRFALRIRMRHRDKLVQDTATEHVRRMHEVALTTLG